MHSSLYHKVAFEFKKGYRGTQLRKTWRCQGLLCPAYKKNTKFVYDCSDLKDNRQRLEMLTEVGASIHLRVIHTLFPEGFDNRAQTRFNR